MKYGEEKVGLWQRLTHRCITDHELSKALFATVCKATV